MSRSTNIQQNSLRSGGSTSPGVGMRLIWQIVTGTVGEALKSGMVINVNPRRVPLSANSFTPYTQLRNLPKFSKGQVTGPIPFGPRVRGQICVNCVTTSAPHPLLFSSNINSHTRRKPGAVEVFRYSIYKRLSKGTAFCTAPQKLDTFGVFFMKYNYEIRLKAVKLVLEGGLSVREAGCHLGCGRSQVHLWVTLFERHGLAGLKLRHGSYSAEFKLSVLKHMHQNHLSLLETAVHFGIPGPFVIRQWERLYQNQGAEGLRRKPQRRRPAMSKSKTKKVKLKTTPHEELLKELEYLRAENAYLKKLQALVEERIVRESGKEPKPSKD